MFLRACRRKEKIADKNQSAMIRLAVYGKDDEFKRFLRVD
jgi:hypothetical protein